MQDKNRFTLKLRFRFLHLFQCICQAVANMTVMTDSCFGMLKRRQNGLFASFDGCAKYEVNAVFMQGLHCHESVTVEMTDRIAGGKSNGNVATAVAEPAAKPCQGGRSTPAYALKLSCIHGNIGGNDHDDGSLFRCFAEK